MPQGGFPIPPAELVVGPLGGELDVLCRLPVLATLKLNYNRVGNVDALRDLASINELELNGNNITNY